MKLLKFPKGSMSIPVIKFMFKDDWKVLGEALNINPKYVSEDFVAANDLHSYLTGQAAGLVVCCMQEKSDLVQIASLIKLNKKHNSNKAQLKQHHLTKKFLNILTKCSQIMN